MSTLDVSNNTIVEIGRAFVDMPELKYLDLSHNHLPAVKEGAFKALPELISLHLDHNSIVELQSDSFQDLESLETIVLTKNGIPAVRRETFRDLPSLEVVRLDDNLIKELNSRSVSRQQPSQFLPSDPEIFVPLYPFSGLSWICTL